MDHDFRNFNQFLNFHDKSSVLEHHPWQLYHIVENNLYYYGSTNMTYELDEH